jgi:molybdopterin synthase catalytic subunit
MNRWLKIQAEPIDEHALLEQRRVSSAMGAAIYFLGIVREQEASTMITALEYEAFEKMARHHFHKIFDQVEKRWPVESLRLVHRIGAVRVNEPSLWVEIVAPHRAEAFQACQFVIDEMKKTVPIWKRPVH